MAHAAIAFAKQMRRRRAMVCTTSIGPGATNLATAAALAHVNRLPVLLIPGDVFATRRPDPVLQQVEDFADGTVSANDCLRPVSRYFDRITRPEQLLDALPRAMATLTDPAGCGPVTLAFCQDVQAQAWDFPEEFLTPRHWRIRAPRPDRHELDQLVAILKGARAPLIIAGGGVPYARAEALLSEFARRTGIPVAETQAGKGSLAWDHPVNLGGVGVTGSSAANETAAAADVIIGLGTRLQDFTTGSRMLFARSATLVQINVSAYDAHKQGAVSVVGDAAEVLTALEAALADWRAPADWTSGATARAAQWRSVCEQVTAPAEGIRPSDAQVLGAVWRQAPADAIVVCAAGGLPGELHKLWRVRAPGGYHLEYGYSCMGYEIAGGLGVKLAAPGREVHVLVGDGSYLMMSSELATSVMLGCKLVVTVLDNRGFGCINRLQQGTGNAPFNNLLGETVPEVDFAAHAASLGARSENVSGIAELEAALGRARNSDRTYVMVIETDPNSASDVGGAWWDVAIPEVSSSESVNHARSEYEQNIRKPRRGES
jgi:3D-(3,5/4)-trihydroxycyclohexane-1,2-dione acylhydrolase (decyclizing)